MSALDARAALRERSRPVVAWHRWRALPASLKAGLTLLAGAILLALAGQLLLPDPLQQNLLSASVPPLTDGHLLGTDSLGRDVLAWTASSVKTSLLVGGATVLISSVIGTAVGLVAGYRGRLLDAGLMRLVDLQLAIPPLLLFIAASASLGTGTVTLVLLISAVGWVPYARVVRTRILVQVRRPSISAARLTGTPHLRVLVRHLLPAATSVILVLASLQFGFVLLAEAGLSFVGLGVQPPDTSLGFLIAQGRATLTQAWWVVVVPGTMLALLLLLSANLIGDGLQELLGVDADEVRA